MHGRLGAMQVLGLPGNPVSSFVCAVLFLVPLMRRLAGPQRPRACRSSEARARQRPPRQRRARRLSAGTLAAMARTGPVATPLPEQDSSMLSPLAHADCLVIREPFAPAAPAGRPCDMLNLELLTILSAFFTSN